MHTREKLINKLLIRYNNHKVTLEETLKELYLQSYHFGFSDGRQMEERYSRNRSAIYKKFKEQAKK